MAGSFESLAGPSYISSRSADVILSDVRPIKLKLEALRSINVFLDEFLHKILNAAGSLSTDSLKAGLNKILPTALGKEAVLEAELELKAYWERNTPHTPAKQEFDLQWSFELLRLKCEAYSTMNDGDEDLEAEKRLNERMINAGSSSSPHNSLMAPAALYLTAILEYICEHVLSNVGRVASRDSSRTVATVHDLFVALCEDSSMYSMFKGMKVYEQIDSLSKMQHPRRSKSMSKSSSGRASPASRTASPHGDGRISRESSSTPSRLRVSSESASPSVTTLLAQPANGRVSYEKSRAKLFGRSSIDQESPEDIRQHGDDAKSSNSFDLMDEAALEEFDELMRSGTTMKVSLTPDRLKSMEVYKQEKKRHKAQENEPAGIDSPDFKRAASSRRARRVDSILEDDEPTLTNEPTTHSSSQTVIVPRARLASLATTPSSIPSTAMNPVRSRSVTISAPLSKKRSNRQMGPPPPPPSINNTFPPKREAPNPNGGIMQNGRPQRTRKIQRSPESLDLDEVMGGDDDFDTPPPTAGRRDSSKPYISKTARDLIDFLDEGPPVELKPPGMNASMISLDSSKSRSGKLQRMMSRLTLGGSSERLNGRGGSTDDMSRGAKGMRRSPSGSSSASAPPTAYLQPMNTRKPLPPVVVATPPPPLASLSLSTSSSFISMEGSMGHNSPHQANPYRRVSITRKAVPSWEDISHTVDVMPPVPAANEDPRSSPKPPKTPKASPLDAFPSVPLTVPQSPSGSGFLARSGGSIRSETSGRRNSATPSPITPTIPEFLPQRKPSSDSRASPSPSASRRATRITDREVVAEPQVLESIAPAAPTFGVEEAQDLRRLLSVATTADECRLLVDMFMCKAGFPLSVTPSIDPDAPKSSSTVDVAASKLETVNDDLESSLVAFLLGGGSRDDIQVPATRDIITPVLLSDSPSQD